MVVPDGKFVGAGDGLFFADLQFGCAGRSDAFAGRVFHGREFERHIPGVLDGDLVFDGLAEFAFQFARDVVGFAFDALLLFDREAWFGGDFGGGFVGGLGAGAFVAFDRGFVGRGADRERVAAGKGLFAADGQFGRARGRDAGAAGCLSAPQI